MTWVFAIPVMGFLAFLVVGSISGRVKLRSCCGIGDPRCDARMRDAFLDGASADKPSRPIEGRQTG
ncbi:hypothetical protein [Nocardioides sp.]|uniref:hypothetical protein n=1 Tax=Nocardioides sp. TaxID=35761 RepID=UPI002F40A2AC